MSFTTAIRPHVSQELASASWAQRQGEREQAFAHLERAHVLGQASTREHVRVHWAMFRWGVANGRPREVVGQVLRIVGAATKTAFGLVPAGNTGGANISPFEVLPVAPDLQAVIDEARSTARRPPSSAHS